MVKYQKEIFFFSLTALVTFLDQMIKYGVLKFQPEIGLRWFSLHLVKNTGAGFGLLKGWTGLLILVSFLAGFLVVYHYKRIPSRRMPQILMALFLGGVVGNLIDRLFRGFVVDFMDFGFWPAFNLADASITLGTIGLVIWFWRKS